MARLTDSYIKAIKPNGKPNHADGGGLVLLLRPNGTLVWRYRYRFAGKANMLSLGNYPEVSLKKAREKHVELKALLEKGINPSLDRQEKRLLADQAQENSFQGVALQWFEKWHSGKDQNYTKQVRARLEDDIFPHIGKRPINEITSPLLLTVIKKIESRGALEAAKRTYQNCGQIFEYAVAHGVCERNPVKDVRSSVFLKSRVKKNFARVEAKELPDLLRKIDAYNMGRGGNEITRLALQLMTYTFVRTGELIGARWDEIDLDTKEWRIPAERMKMKMPHIVLLSDQSLAIFKRLHEISGGRELIFPSASKPKKSMSYNTLLYALYRMGFQGIMTGHGFRGVASTILHEQGYNHEHIELQLAHAPRNAVSASYNHALYLPQRRVMLQDWANYLDGIKAGADVVAFRAKAS